MKNIEAMILKLVKSKTGRESFVVHYLNSNWVSICGANIAKHSKPTRIDKGILFINTDNAAWSHNLLMMKPQLLGKINSNLPKSGSNRVANVVIRDIMFFNGKVNSEKVQEENSEEKIVLKPLTEEEKIEIYEKTEQISNPEIRAAFLRIMQDDKKRKKALLEAGKKQCKDCGVPIIVNDDYCAACARKKKAALAAKVAEILNSAPWLSYEDCINYVKCDKMLFGEIKENVKNKAYKKVLPEDCCTEDKIFFTLLELEISPEKLTDELIEETVGRIRRNAYVSSSGGRLRSKK